MTTVSIHMPEQTGLTGLTLFLRKTSDGALLNAGGDTLAESPASSGRFVATVAETWAETLAAAILSAGGLTVRDGWLASGETIVRDAYPSTGGSGGSGDASQATLIEVQDVVDSIAVALAGGSPVEPTGVTVFGLLAMVINTLSEHELTIDDIAAALAGGNGSSVFEYLRQLSNAGAGENTVTITVNDGTAPIQNALVRMIDGGNTFSALTDASGVATFQLDDATYVVAISRAGYSYAGTTLVVNGTENETYSMTLNTLVLPSLGQVARRSIPVTVVDRIT